MTDIKSTVMWKSLMSNLCPACGDLKRPKHSLCRKCYGLLSPTKRNALYMRMGRGYEEAVTDALTTLDVTEPHWK